MMTGELPYKQQIGTSYRIKSLNHMKYRSLMTLRPDLPEWIDKTFERAVAPHVRDRYQAMSEFCFDLSQPDPAYLKKLAIQPLIEKIGIGLAGSFQRCLLGESVFVVSPFSGKTENRPEACFLW